MAPVPARAGRGCCCCTAHPGVVSSAITLIVVSCVAIVAFIVGILHNTSSVVTSLWPPEIYRSIEVPTLCLLDLTSCVVAVITAASIVHLSTDRLAACKPPPFFRFFLMLVVAASLQLMTLLLGAIESCVTSPGRVRWWYVVSYFDSFSCRTSGVVLIIPRGIHLLALMVCGLFVACARRSRAVSPGATTEDGISLSSAVSSASASADLDGLSFGGDGENASSSASTSTTTTTTKGVATASGTSSGAGIKGVKAAASTARTARRSWRAASFCRSKRHYWLAAALGAAVAAATISTVVEVRLRQECSCQNTDWGAVYEEERYCKRPEADVQPFVVNPGKTEDDYQQFESCAAFAVYLRGGLCPGGSGDTGSTWYARPPSFMMRTFGLEDDFMMFAARGGGEVEVMALSADASTGMSAAAASAESGGGTASADSSGASSGGPSFSTTNVQVEGVDEADIVKTDGHYLYTLTPARRYSSDAMLSIVRTWPAEDARIESTIRLSSDGPYGVEPRQMMLHGDRLLVVGTAWHNDGAAATAAAASGSSRWPSFIPRWGRGYTSTVRLLVFNVTDRSAPLLERVEELEGYLVAARKVDGRVYVVTQAMPVFPWTDGEAALVTADDLLPRRRTLLTRTAATPGAPFGAIGGGCQAIGYVPSVKATSLVVVASLDLADGSAPLRTSVATGRGANVYASRRSLYVASNKWSSGVGSQTMVLRFALNDGDVQFAGSASAAGFILNEWAMDEHTASPTQAALSGGGGGVTFRLVTTTDATWDASGNRASTGVNHLFTFAVHSATSAVLVGASPGMTPLGELEDLAPGERVYAVRFMGERLYIVTFRQVDPLFVIDVSAPAAPVLLGELKVPGYSDYLHPINSSHLIGIGKDASDSGVVRGMKLALFDASTPTAPAESYSLIIGDRGTHSEALDDHKAFTYDTARRLLTLPVTVHLGAACSASWPESAWQGAAVWHVGETEFGLQGLVPHYEPSLVSGPAAENTRDTCTNECYYSNDGVCHDGGPGAEHAWCAGGTDCTDCGPPLVSTGLPTCTRWESSSCTAGASTRVKRALYIGTDVLYTVSPLKVRADSIAAMANLTAAARALTNSTDIARDAVTSAAAAAWEAALNGSRIVEVPLPHTMCGGGDAPLDGNWPVLALEATITPEAGAEPPSQPPAPNAPPQEWMNNPPPPPCACECYSMCALGQESQATAAAALMGIPSSTPPPAPPPPP